MDVSVCRVRSGAARLKVHKHKYIPDDFKGQIETYGLMVQNSKSA